MQEFHKMPSVKRCSVFAWCIVICVMFVFACTTDQEMNDPKASLERLAEQYWTKRLVERDYKFSFNMELEKDSLSFSDYCQKVKASEKFNCSSVKTKEVQIEDDKGFVYMTIECKTPAIPKQFNMTLQDMWLCRSNQWKHKFTYK